MGLKQLNGKTSAIFAPNLAEAPKDRALFTSKANNGCKLLDDLILQENSENRKQQEQTPNKTVIEIAAAFEKFLLGGYLYYRTNSTWSYYSVREETYERIVEIIKPIKCNSSDIALFTTMLATLQDSNICSSKGGSYNFSHGTGLFISALINSCPDSDFVVNTAALNVGIRAIGYKNTKNIIINGNAGSHAGYQMAGGSLTIYGDAGDYLGFMLAGGKITLNGNAGIHAGHGLEGGELTINGNADILVSGDIRGGILRINGNIGSIWDHIPLLKGDKNFSIFQRDIQLAKDGITIAEPINL